MNKIVIAVCLILSFNSCKKESQKVSETLNFEAYGGLKVGQYRVYETYYIDQNGHETRDTINMDSVVITDQVTLNGNQYYRETHFSNKIKIFDDYLRDSLHYMVNHRGQIYYSSLDFQIIFKSDFVIYGDTVCKREFFMCDKDKITTIPAGSFQTITYRNKMYNYPKVNGQYPITNADMIYAKDVGLIFESAYSAGSIDTHSERRLVRYGKN